MEIIEPFQKGGQPVQRLDGIVVVTTPRLQLVALDRHEGLIGVPGLSIGMPMCQSFLKVANLKVHVELDAIREHAFEKEADRATVGKSIPGGLGQAVLDDPEKHSVSTKRVQLWREDREPLQQLRLELLEHRPPEDLHLIRTYDKQATSPNQLTAGYTPHGPAESG